MNYSCEVRKIDRRKVKLNFNLPGVNNFDIKEIKKK